MSTIWQQLGLFDWFVWSFWSKVKVHGTPQDRIQIEPITRLLLFWLKSCSRSHTASICLTCSVWTSCRLQVTQNSWQSGKQAVVWWMSRRIKPAGDHCVGWWNAASVQPVVLLCFFFHFIVTVTVLWLCSLVFLSLGWISIHGHDLLLLAHRQHLHRPPGLPDDGSGRGCCGPGWLVSQLFCQVSVPIFSSCCSSCQNPSSHSRNRATLASWHKPRTRPVTVTVQ